MPENAQSTDAEQQLQIQAEVQRSLSRRSFLKAGLGAAALAAAGSFIGYRAMTSEQTVVDPIDPELFGYYGILAHQRLQEAYRMRSGSAEGLYYDVYPNTNAVAENWSFSHVLAANIDTAGTNGSNDSHRATVEASVNGLNYYWYDNPSAGVPAYRARIFSPGTYEKYYDDNAWNGLNLVRAGRQTQDEYMINRAQDVYEFILSGISSADTCAPGGIYWKQRIGNSHPDINTVSNAPNAQLGLRLYQLTEKNIYADAALQMYRWTNEYMRDPNDGLYWDHMNKKCAVDKTKWTYNQGTMIGANVLLGELTNETSYIRDAEYIAIASLAHFVHGQRSIIEHQPIEFNAVYFRNLLVLAHKTSDRELGEYIRATAEAYAQSVWPKLFVHQKNIPMYTHYKLIQQAAIVEMIAMLGWHGPDTDLLI